MRTAAAVLLRRRNGGRFSDCRILVALVPVSRTNEPVTTLGGTSKPRKL